jgi:succinoglycan biosynthesis protein ExoM
MSVDLAIIICTFRRNDLLRKLLTALNEQALPENFALEVLVVDNSDDGQARSVVEAAQGPLPIRWMEAHPANISVARNAGVAASDASFVAFIDDDQIPEPGWLLAASQALRNEAADAWLGRTIADFEAPELVTPAISTLFSRELAEGAGFELYAFGPRKLGSLSLATNNAMFRRATCFVDAEIFDPAFGKGGGEDYDLFCRLQRLGRRFVWAPDMAVRESVPASRCDRAYLRRRFYAGGQAFAAAIARGGANPAVSRWGLRAKALVQAFILAASAPRYSTSDEKTQADYFFRWAGVLGKLSFGEIYPIYQPKQ